MCQRGLRREPCNEGLLLLLLAGVLLLFSPSPPGSSVLPGCEARLLPFHAEPLVHEARGGQEGRGDGSSLGRILAAGRPKSPAPSPAPTPAAAAIASKSSPKAAPKAAPVISTAAKSSGWSRYWYFLAGPAVFLILVATVIGAMVRLMLRKRRREAGTTWNKGLSFHDNEQLEKYSFAGIPTIAFEELEAACEEFTNVIGSSTDCSVFKGTRVSDGVPIAVTRMIIPPDRWTARREIGFRHKVEDLARMNHDNLVNLIAYCATDVPFERMLVFEYASNGTLYEHLHAREAAEDHLDWATRMRIVMGAACGLEYLHHKLVPATSLFKFDARHVFLTEDYAAKLADFAISPDSRQFSGRTLGRRESFARIVTSVGFSEWEAHKYTPNLDRNIQSFGVFLLEVITGRRPFTETQGPLTEWAKEYLTDAEKMRLMVDPSLKDYKRGELEAICEAAKMCLRPKGHKIPTMRDLADMLSKALHLTREAANSKTSPLLWAEMQLLNSMEHSMDDVSLGGNSPKSPTGNFPKSLPLSSQDSPLCNLTSQGSGKKLGGSLRRPLSPGATNVNSSYAESGSIEQQMAAGKQSPRTKHAARSLSSKRSWTASTKLEDDDSSGSDSLEIPLAASMVSSAYLSSSRGSHETSGRSFRRVWAENAAELAKAEGRPSGHLGR